MDASKIAKIRSLAERGATEGERAAAREALRRLGERQTVASPSAHSSWNAPSHPDQIYADMAEMFKKLGITAEDVMKANEQLSKLLERMMSETVERSAKPSHGGRVYYDRS